MIRPFTPDDVEAMHVLFSDPEVMRYIPRPPSQDIEESRPRVERHIRIHETYGYALWAIVEKASAMVIGDAGLIPFEGKGPEVEVGYHLRRDCWGKGYATEAAAECLRYGFEELRLPRILAVTFPENMASRRVLTKIGMTEQGMTRAYDFDCVLFEMKNPLENG